MVDKNQGKKLRKLAANARTRMKKAVANSVSKKKSIFNRKSAGKSVVNGKLAKMHGPYAIIFGQSLWTKLEECDDDRVTEWVYSVNIDPIYAVATNAVELSVFKYIIDNLGSYMNDDCLKRITEIYNARTQASTKDPWEGNFTEFIILYDALEKKYKKNPGDRELVLPISFKIAGTYYNCSADVSYFKGYDGPRLSFDVSLTADGAPDVSLHFSFREEDARQENTLLLSMKEILASSGIAPPIENLDTSLYRTLSKTTGTLYTATGNMVGISTQFEGFFQKLDTIPTEADNLVIQDSEHEAIRKDGRNNYRSHETAASHIPLVRVFCLRKKAYFWIDPKQLTPYAYKNANIDDLVIPDRTKNIVSLLVNKGTNSAFTDLISGKSGGVVILAEGPTGVGKTLTAEITAEVNQRPLYVVETRELGAQIGTVEVGLKSIFERATRWNAVLLFDEADVFVSRRGEDLERNAIVGIFLRLMDYYHGILFMTTNLEEKIDDAILSRVTVVLKYKQFSIEDRRKVWERLLAKANITVNGLDRASRIHTNGRLMRNTVKLLSLKFGRGVTVTEQDLITAYEDCTGIAVVDLPEEPARPGPLDEVVSKIKERSEEVRQRAVGPYQTPDSRW